MTAIHDKRVSDAEPPSLVSCEHVPKHRLVGGEGQGLLLHTLQGQLTILDKAAARGICSQKASKGARLAILPSVYTPSQGRWLGLYLL